MMVLHGYAAGKGIAIGRAHLVVRGISELPQYHLPESELDGEVARFDAEVTSETSNKSAPV